MALLSLTQTKVIMVSLCQTILRLSIFTCFTSLAVVEFSAVEATASPSFTVAQTTDQKANAPDRPVRSHNSQADLESEILAEINRARTDPSAYAAWLQEQKQYYNGILLKLPGEKPIRTNKGLQALEEAIAFLQNLQPLPALDSSEKLTTVAATKIDNLFSAKGDEFNHVTYGRVTAKAIVMQLVVDDGFPDRRHRISLFKPDTNLTGVSCQPDQRYSTICAIAYEGEIADIAAQPNTQESALEPPEVIIEPNSEELTPETPEVVIQPNTQESTPETPEVIVQPNTQESASESSETSTSGNDEAILPEPPQPSTSENTVTASESGEDNVDAQTTAVNSELNTEAEKPEVTETEKLPEPEPEIAEQKIPVPEVEMDSEAENIDEELEAEAESNDDSGNIATASDSNLLEKIKRGTLEEGDQIVPNDGSFYDSYPLEGKKGDSFTITLESDEFDTFVAIMDAEGNVIEQNDDLNQEDSNSRLEITLPSDGVYNVIVNAYDEGGQGNYVLTVSR